MDQFLRQMDEVLEVPFGTCKPHDRFRDFESWSSLAVLGLFCILDEQYGVTLSTEHLDQLSTIEDIWNVVQERRRQAAA